MREILLHGGHDDAYDRSVLFARRLAETFGARLHILYTLEDPLSAGWTAEVSADRLPELHNAIEEEARERLARLIGLEDQEALNIQLELRTGPAEREITRFTEERTVDLAILQAPLGSAKSLELARALIEHGRCAVLVLR
jgi:nucleotide-binding universal stress UspA family protein